MKPQSTPDEFSTVSPHLMVNNIEAQIDFQKAVFNATIVDEFKDKTGRIMHATTRVGEATIMIGLARTEFPSITSMNYVFVEKADHTFQLAVEHGASPIMKPEDQFFGHRQGAVKDHQGNVWWIAEFIRKVSADELARNMPG